VASFVSAGASTESQLNQPATKITGNFPFASSGLVMMVRSLSPARPATES
jgi:hypothetical protein